MPRDDASAALGPMLAALKEAAERPFSAEDVERAKMIAAAAANDRHESVERAMFELMEMLERFHKAAQRLTRIWPSINYRENP